MSLTASDFQKENEKELLLSTVLSIFPSIFSIFSMHLSGFHPPSCTGQLDQHRGAFFFFSFLDTDE